MKKIFMIDNKHVTSSIKSNKLLLLFKYTDSGDFILKFIEAWLYDHRRKHLKVKLLHLLVAIDWEATSKPCSKPKNLWHHLRKCPPTQQYCINIVAIAEVFYIDVIFIIYSQSIVSIVFATTLIQHCAYILHVQTLHKYINNIDLISI